MLFLTTLNGCVQGIALLGPAFSYSKSGNLLQAGLSYGSNMAVKKIRDKSSTRNTENTYDNSTADNNDLLDLFKIKIENSSGVKNLANQ